MGVRFAVLAETAQECAEGLALLQRLAQLGVDVNVVQRPAQIAGDRWIARAVHSSATPAGEGQGREG